MKNFSFVLAALSAIILASCSQKASVSLSLAGVEDGSELILKRLDVDVWHTVDTLKLKSGKVSARLDVVPTNPQFLYFFRGDKTVAAVILKSGEKVSVEADTLGNYSVSGSEDSELLRQFNLDHSEFVKSILMAATPREMGEVYVARYQKNARDITNHPYSMVNVPVMFEKIGPNAPVFSQPTDAIRFRAVADSLMTKYPDSPFVKALDKEAATRERLLELQLKMDNSKNINYPELNIASIDGSKVSLNSLDAKVILLYFWNADDARQKMLNMEYLMPLYSTYNSKGFDIYSVAITSDKVSWASVIGSQELPWTNVCDGLGRGSRSLITYNVTELPCCMLLSKDGIEKISKLEDIKNLLPRKLK